MDQDELLARQLQEEEFFTARAVGRQPSADADSKETLVRALTGGVERVRQADDELNQALAMSCMPLDELQATARRTFALNQSSSTLGHGTPALDERDHLMMELLLWFKACFFSWVDKPTCPTCHVPGMSVGVEPPTGEESAHQCSRAEVFECRTCSQRLRFPRYNSVSKLLETRCGRCGEWANTFLLCCRTAGFVARYVWDIHDHVWTEYWSEGQQRWVHLDPCEAAYDKPLLYEAGWGKSMLYVLAVGPLGAADVTSRYTAKWGEVLSRRVTRAPEAWLEAQLATMTQTLRQGLPAPLIQQCQVQDASERMELELRRRGVVTEADLQGLAARTTGSEEWRQVRGEAGADGGASSVPPPSKPTSTPWQALPLGHPTDHLPGLGQGRAQLAAQLLELVGRPAGGGSRAAGENGKAEGSQQAFDADATSKWLDFSGGGEGATTWLEFQLEPGQGPVELVAYDVVSANDCAERDPCSWVLEALASNPSPNPDVGQDPSGAGPASLASQQGGGTWVALDERNDVLFSARHQLRSFWVPPGAASGSGRFCRFRLRVTRLRDPVAANSVQLACLNLYARTAAWAAAGSNGGGGAPGTVEAAAALAAQVLAPPPGSGSPVLDALPLSMLRKLVGNVVGHPGDLKFRCVRASKVQALWQHPPTLALLLALGFRPLILVTPSGGATAGAPWSKDLCLVLEGSPVADLRAAAVAKALGP